MATRSVPGDRRSPSRGDQQRARIIHSVTALLADTAITDLSVMQIAKHAGVTRPVFYFYFQTKYAVVGAALHDVWSEFDAARAGVRPQELGQDPAAITGRLIGDARAIWQRHGPLLNACVLARASDPQLDAMWTTFVESQAQRVAELLNGLAGRARIRPASADLPALIDVLFGMTVWALVGESTDPQAMSGERRIDAITAVWLSAVWGEGLR
jgi:AcrR family transcriptional regulator